MTDDTGDPKPWDLEQYRGVRRHVERKEDWEKEQDLILDQAYRTGKVVPKYDTEGPSLFWLAMITSVLTVLTLGFYRFWMVTRLRRHYWNAIRVQGDPFEYTGTGLEKFLGFLVAVIILAVYLGLVNIGLAFLGLSYAQHDSFVITASIVASLPLIFFAVYRAHRYIMARTRWRGIRFGMDNGAWGYAFRATWYWFLTIVTGGLLYPYQQFKLAKYITDRTWFGDIKFVQKGTWAGLFAYWVWLYIVLGMMILAIWGLAADQGNPATSIIGWLILFVGYMTFFILLLRYEVVVFRYLWSHRRLGDAAFESNVSPGQIISTYLLGSLRVGVFTTIIFIAVMFLIGVVLQATGSADLAETMTMGGTRGEAQFGELIQSKPAFVAIIVMIYLFMFAVPFALAQVFITKPVLRRKAEAMVIHDAQTLTQSRQREHDRAAEAGGFADALGVDVGAGI